MSTAVLLAPAPKPRGVARRKVFLPAEMTGATGASRVHLLNLSPVGALLHAESPPATGAILQLRCAATSWVARVVWARQQRFGVVHLTPLAATAIEVMVSARSPDA